MRNGDTLARIAARLGIPDWADLWWWNRATVRDPNVIRTGQELIVWRYRVPYASWPGYVRAAAMAAIPHQAPVRLAAAHPAAQADPPAAAPDPGLPAGGSALAEFARCVVSRESGGNAQVMNSSGHYGLFQFSYSTWVLYGGAGGDFGHASPGEQWAVFYRAMATPAGASNWSPYDGCQYGVDQGYAYSAKPLGSSVSYLAAVLTPKRLIALRWARTQQGKPYQWGGTGPYGYDCSGLVMEAYLHAGIALPRTTYEMLASSKLIPIPSWDARWGDLAFYGSGHVELFMGNNAVHVTYGAHAPGSVVSPITYGWGWVPTMWFRVAGAG